MFTPKHFIWIGSCALFVIVMCLVSIRKKYNLKTAGLIMCVIGLSSEVNKMLTNMLPSEGGGMHLDPLCLPFHLCSLFLFVVLYITFAKDSPVKDLLVNFTAVMGSMGSFCAILIPTNGTDFTTPYAYQCFVYHAGLMWFSLYLILSKKAKPGQWKNLIHNMILLLSIAFATLYMNGALSVYDTNFLFLTRPPMENLPYLNLDHGWFVYFLRILLLGGSALILFHLPFIVHEHKKAPDKKSEALT